MKLAELATERGVLTSQIKAIDVDMRTLEGAVLILDGHRTGVRPAKRRAISDSPQPSMERGAFTKAVLEVLRDAAQPLTVMETGQAVLQRLGLPEDAMARSKLSTKVLSAATSYVQKGTLRRVEREGEVHRLEVAR